MPLQHRKKLRLDNYDYTTDNKYFITTNVQNFVSCLGVIIKGKMHLNVYGEIVKNQIKWLETQYSYVKIHSSEVMPDHIHFVIEIDKRLAISGQKIKSIPSLIGAFKTTSSKAIRLGGYKEFQWHRSYYDRIIRDDFELMRIQDYIYQNPENWNQRRI